MSGDDGEEAEAALLALGAVRVYFKPFPSLDDLAADQARVAAAARPK